MNLQSVLGFSLAGVSLVVSIGFFAHQPVLKAPEPDIPQAPTLYTEFMPESSGESIRTHILDRGVETEVHIKYLDESKGVLLLYPNGKTRLESRAFPDGSSRKQANFDSEGVLTSGYEYRSDRTLLWKTALSDDRSTTITNVYWPSGQLFLARKFDRAKKTSIAAFYRESGVLLQEMEYRNSDKVLSWQKNYDELGRLRVARLLVVEGVNQPVLQVVYFSEDGKPEFDQYYGYSADYYWDPESALPNRNRLVVKSVGIYENADLTKRIYINGDRKIHMIDRFFANGSTERSYAQRDGNITQIQTLTPGGATSRFNFDGLFGKVSPLDSGYLMPLQSTDLPYEQFNALEAQREKAH